MRERILHSVKNSITAVEQLLQEPSMTFIERAALLLAQCFTNGRKIIVAGNGGSLCDAAHFAEELTGQFRLKRRALPAIALSEPGHITCTANDMGFDQIFSRGVEAFGKKGDLFIGLTTSGNSINLIKAFEKSKEMGLISLAFLGKGGGLLKGVADYELLIDKVETSDRIQEAHMTAIHIIIEIMEYHLFEEPALHHHQFHSKPGVHA